VAAVGASGLGLVILSCESTNPPAASVDVPTYAVDALYPKALPNNWTLGETWGVAVDSNDHPWVLHSTTHHDNLPAGQTGDVYDVVAKEGKKLAPPVVEFDSQGDLVQAWGGPGSGYQWPEGKDWAEHGLWIDGNGDVWIAGNGHVVLKFTDKGKFLLQLGKLWYTGGSNDKQLLGKPTTMGTDKDTKEVYVADGYYNQRVAVFDAKTGAFHRQFGAYGKPIDLKYDGKDSCGEKHNVDCAYGQHNSQIAAKLDPPPDHFAPVHCARVSNDGLVYVCDRSHNRIQVFKTDGTYVNEVFLDKEGNALWDWDAKTKKPIRFTRTAPQGGEYGSLRGAGSASNATLSRDPENKYLIVGGGPSHRRIYILERKTLRLLDEFDHVQDVHEIAIDSKLNLYTVGGRSRDVTKLVFKGMRPLK
jgi:hypothetical protein